MVELNCIGRLKMERLKDCMSNIQENKNFTFCQ
jgi:hypothetical protein